MSQTADWPANVCQVRQSALLSIQIKLSLEKENSQSGQTRQIFHRWRQLPTQIVSRQIPIKKQFAPAMNKTIKRTRKLTEIWDLQIDQARKGLKGIWYLSTQKIVVQWPDSTKEQKLGICSVLKVSELGIISKNGRSKNLHVCQQNQRR